MKNLKIVFFITLFCACSKEEQILNSPYLGEHKILSLKSDIALDLNRDSTPSTNFLSELEQYYNKLPSYNLAPLAIVKSGDNPILNGFNLFMSLI